MASDLEEIEVRLLSEWREWLAKNHTQTKGIWLVSYKKHSDFYVPFGQIVDQALCFGWVDSSVRGVDEDRFKHLLSPRKTGSNWSKVNKDKVAVLTTTGQMHPSGLAKVEAAKRDGSWTFLDDVEALLLPDDLNSAFDAYPKSRVHWDAFSRSAKRGILEWIKNAKRAETRTRRIKETA